jgi:probable rRNA maturation factor
MKFNYINKGKLGDKGLNLLEKFDFPNTKENSLSINVIFVDNSEIRRLNFEYRQKDQETDILSFNFNEQELLGELYISLDYVKDNHKRYETNFETEVLRLIIHGTLHLLGFDHETEFVKNPENIYTEKMFEIQEDLLSSVL